MADNYVSVNSAPSGDTKMQTYLNTIASNAVHAEAVVLVNSSGSPLTTFPVTGPLTDTQLRSSPVNIITQIGDAVFIAGAGGGPVEVWGQSGNPVEIQGQFGNPVPVSGTGGGPLEVTGPAGNPVDVNIINTSLLVRSSNASNFLTSVSGTVTSNQGGTWYVQSINSTSTVNSPNASNFLATVIGTVGVNSITNPVTVAQSNASNFLSTVSGTVTAVSSNASNFLATVSGTVGITANSTVDLSRIVGTTVDVNSGTKSAGTQRVVIATDQPQLTNKLLVTPDANSSFNLSQVVGTTADVNSGNKSAGTLRVVLATDQPALSNKLLVTPDANSSFNLSQIVGTTADTNSGSKSAGTLRVVLATDQPALTNKLLVTPDANSSFNLGQIGGSAVVSAAAGVQKVAVAGSTGTNYTETVSGVRDVISRKFTGSTGLAPTFISGRINTSTTTQLTQSTCYLSSLRLVVYTAGTTWALNVTDRQAIPLPLVPNFVVTNVVGANNPIVVDHNEPIICTSGINVITVGGTAGNIAYFATYWS